MMSFLQLCLEAEVEGEGGGGIPAPVLSRLQTHQMAVSASEDGSLTVLESVLLVIAGLTERPDKRKFSDITLQRERERQRGGERKRYVEKENYREKEKRELERKRRNMRGERVLRKKKMNRNNQRK